MIVVIIENANLKLALAVPAGARITLAKETIDTPPLASEKSMKPCQNSLWQQCIY